MTFSAGGTRSARAALASPIRVRRSKMSASVTFSPRISAVPWVGGSRAAATWRSVVLPAPFGPITTQLSPLWTVQSTSRSSIDFSRRMPSPRSRSTSSDMRSPPASGSSSSNLRHPARRGARVPVPLTAMSEPQITLLITLTGRDRPGVTSRLFAVLAAHRLSVIDVEQVVIRGHLVLGVLLCCDDAPDLTAIHRQVGAVATDLDLAAEITTGSGDQPRRRGSLHVTVLGSPLAPAAIAAIAGRIAASGANIDRIGRLAHRPVTCIEFEVSGADPDTLRAALARESLDQRADVAVQRGGLHRRAMRLVMMDVDSTLIRGEAIDLLAGRAGCQRQGGALARGAQGR